MRYIPYVYEIELYMHLLVLNMDMGSESRCAKDCCILIQG